VSHEVVGRGGLLRFLILSWVLPAQPDFLIENFVMSLMPSLKARSLAKLFLQSPSTDGSNVMGIAWQMDHRLDLVSFWDISPGSRVLEIGCGQGDCTVVLADAVGESGHVDAVDPGAPDYGRLVS